MTPGPHPVFYYDLGSPYAYLAAERATNVLGVEPRLEPILLGGIFRKRGHGSWAHTAERQERVNEVEGRAETYGLPTLRWPGEWPNNTLAAMRAALWADRRGAGRPFALAAFRRAFRYGADLSRIDELASIAESVGLPEEGLRAAVDEPAIKEALRAATARAWSRGVIGAPSVEIAGDIYFGDDRLEEAAAARLAAERSG